MVMGKVNVELLLIFPVRTTISAPIVCIPQNTMTSVFLTDIVLIVLAMMIINLSEKGQCPLWWLGSGWGSAGGSMVHLTDAPSNVKKSLASSTKDPGSVDEKSTFDDETV